MEGSAVVGGGLVVDWVEMGGLGMTFSEDRSVHTAVRTLEREALRRMLENC